MRSTWILLVFITSTVANEWSESDTTSTQRPIQTKYHSGRHVCSSESVKKFEAYKKPNFQSYSRRCHNNKVCRGIRVTYETAYRDVYDSKASQPPTFVCCPGWAQVSKTSHSCNKPVCSTDCLNGGTCSMPDRCTCPPGYKGLYCETDINECQETRPCDHTCINTNGSYHCSCKPGYFLQSDGKTCLKKVKTRKADGKDYDVEILARKLSKLEKIVKSSKYELQTELSDSPTNSELQSAFESLQKKMETLNRNQQEHWSKLESELERLQPLCRRVDSIERRIDQCGICNCRDRIIARILP
uniref:EGF-like domain-containing protein n=1 Tax=Clastoptera arizonana TaxID=38151 RepID=A0A1B6ED49_9HEMI